MIPAGGRVMGEGRTTDKVSSDYPFCPSDASVLSPDPHRNERSPLVILSVPVRSRSNRRQGESVGLLLRGLSLGCCIAERCDACPDPRFLPSLGGLVDGGADERVG